MCKKTKTKIVQEQSKQIHWKVILFKGLQSGSTSLRVCLKGNATVPVRREFHVRAFFSKVRKLNFVIFRKYENSKLSSDVNFMKNRFS